jgi:hypothetical protein
MVLVRASAASKNMSALEDEDHGRSATESRREVDQRAQLLHKTLHAGAAAVLGRRRILQAAGPDKASWHL